MPHTIQFVDARPRSFRSAGRLGAEHRSSSRPDTEVPVPKRSGVHTPMIDGTDTLGRPWGAEPWRR